MRLIYITNSRLPTEKAYGINIVKTCQALADAKVHVTLIAPQVRNTSGDDIFSYYGISQNFKICYMPVFDGVSTGWKFGFLFNQISFSLVVFFSYLLKKRKGAFFLVRDEMTGFLLCLSGYSVFYDMHGFPEYKQWLWKIIMRKMAGIIVTNLWKKEQCKAVFGIPETKVTISPNGFDPALFCIEKEKNDLRRELHLPCDKHIVMYTGHLYGWKGALVLLQAARNFKFQSTQKTLFVFVGGTKNDVFEFRKKAQGLNNVLILGHKPYIQIPRYLKAADVLVLPNSSAVFDKRMSVFSERDTAPIKLFEYMASNVPIVASDLPSIGEVLNKENAILVEADNPRNLIEGIKKAITDRSFSNKISEKARNDANLYTWGKRATSILQFIHTVT